MHSEPVEMLMARRKAASDKNRRLAEIYGGVRADTPKRCASCKEIKDDEHFASDKYKKDGQNCACRPCVAEQYARWSSGPGFLKRLNKQKEMRRELKLTNPRLRWARMAKNATQRRATQRGETSGLTVEWLLDNAPERCPLLGVKLRYDGTRSSHDSAAVDRIDNTRGYTPENCWVISMKANRIKTDATLDEIETFTRNFRNLMAERKANPYAA